VNSSGFWANAVVTKAKRANDNRKIFFIKDFKLMNIKFVGFGAVDSKGTKAY
jgi:hypothetical protein